MRERGFTVVEMLIVVLLLGLIMQATRANMTPGLNMRVEIAAEEVANAMRFARDEAVRTGDIYGVRVEQTTNRVRVFRVDTEGVPTIVYDVRHPFTKQTWDIDLDTHPTAAGVNVTTSTNWAGSCSAPSFVAFVSAGTPTCVQPATSRLQDAEVTLSYGNSQMRVRLDGLTARVSFP